jgi:hypothetical protein
MHRPAPVVALEVEVDRGPVLVTIEYRIDPRDREPFLAALEKLARERRRDGAYAWGVFEDSAIEGRMVETFLVESWLEHLRQHERVTNADRVLQDTVQRFHTEGTPKVWPTGCPTSGEFPVLAVSKPAEHKFERRCRGGFASRGHPVSKNFPRLKPRLNGISSLGSILRRLKTSFILGI